MTPRVIIADDHPVVRMGLRAALEASGAATVVAEAGGPDELFDALKRVECDVVVTDFAMPGGTHADGLSLLSGLVRRHGETPVILVTMFANVAILRSALDAGVQGVVAKEASVQELPAAITAVVAGRRYISQSLREQLLTDTPDGALDVQTLSLKEMEVVRLFASGLSTSDIAVQLNRTASTISKQKASAMERLGLTSEVDLLLYAFTSGLVPKPPI